MPQPFEADYVLLKQLAICTGDISPQGIISVRLSNWCVTALVIDKKWGDRQKIQAVLDKVSPQNKWGYFLPRLSDAALVSLSDKLLEEYNKQDPAEVLLRLAQQGAGDSSLTPVLKRFLQLKIFELSNL